MEKFPLFHKGQKLQLLKFTWREPSKGDNEKSKLPRQQLLADMQNFHRLLAETEGGLSAKAATEAFGNDHLNRTVVFKSTDEIGTEVSHAALPAFIQKTHQELEEEEMLDGIISSTVEKVVKALVCSVLGECSDEMIKPQQQQVAVSAAKQLIDIFLLECLIGKMSLQGPRFSEKEHSSMVLDNLMFDILLQQFFSIQQQQQATFENIPLRDFHLKAFTEVALDVILTELNKLAVEDMEDLREYERGAQAEGSRTEALRDVSES